MTSSSKRDPSRLLAFPDRRLPCNADIEKSVLQELFFLLREEGPVSLSPFLTKLQAESFYAPVHCKVFEIIKDAVASGVTDAMLLIDRVKLVCGGVADATDLMYTTDLITSAAFHTEERIFELNRLARRRALIRSGTEHADMAFTEEDPEKIEASLVTSIHTSAMKLSAGKSFGVEVAESEFEEMKTTLHGASLFSLNINQVDGYGRFLPGYGIFAGRPHHGKTALAISVTLNNALMGKRVFYWTGEQPKKQFYLKAVCQLGNVSASQVLGLAACDAETTRRIQIARDRFRDLPVRFMDRKMPLQGIANCAMEMKLRGGLDLVVIDQMSMIPIERGVHGMTKEQILGENSRQLQTLWQMLGCTVILLVQLNIKLQNDQKGDTSPQYWHLKDCSQMYEDCDWFVVIDRPEQDPSRMESFEERRRKFIEKGDVTSAMQCDVAGKGILRLVKERNALVRKFDEMLVFNHACGRFQSASGRDPLCLITQAYNDQGEELPI